MRISALRRPCFYVRPQYTRRGTKSQARRHNPPRRCVCYTIAKLERREAGYESRSRTARRAAGRIHCCPQRYGAGSGGCVRVQQVHRAQGRCRAGAASALRCTGRCVPCWPATRPSATCGAVLPPGADTAAAKVKKDRCPAQRSFLTGTEPSQALARQLPRRGSFLHLPVCIDEAPPFGGAGKAVRL